MLTSFEAHLIPGKRNIHTISKWGSLEMWIMIPGVEYSKCIGYPNSETCTSFASRQDLVMSHFLGIPSPASLPPTRMPADQIPLWDSILASALTSCTFVNTGEGGILVLNSDGDPGRCSHRSLGAKTLGCVGDTTPFLRQANPDRERCNDDIHATKTQH